MSVRMSSEEWQRGTSTVAEYSHQMKLLFALDPRAHLVYSDYTDKWFVSARIEIAQNGMLSGITEHRDSVGRAIEYFLERLKEVGNTPETRYKQALKARPNGEYRYYTWNGAAFAECDRPDNH